MYISMNKVEQIKQKECILISNIDKELIEFIDICTEDGIVIFHQDDFAINYDEDEYDIIGRMIKFIGIRGNEIRIIGRNRESLSIK